jgi:hypothetical protein
MTKEIITSSLNNAQYHESTPIKERINKTIKIKTPITRSRSRRFFMLSFLYIYMYKNDNIVTILENYAVYHY